jgi:cold shock CspA family protein
MPYGRLKVWNQDGGWGYIAPGDRAKTGGDVFVHIRQMKAAGIRAAEVGDAFCYEIVVHGGRAAAFNLERVERVVG